MMTPTIQLACRAARRHQTPRLRTLREFAETEIILPTGPYEGRRYSCSRQPYSYLWFDAVQSGTYRRIVTTGPSQSGKTLMGFVIPIMYHLFEWGETVICGLPSLDMSADKWSEDLLPAIAASRYRDLLPRTGASSKGGTSNLTRVTFNNGATLRFMTGGGNDKARAGFTSRVVVITETDGMDAAGDQSREADPITQLEARSRAFGENARTYMECTVSLEDGRTWQEYTKGTHSRIVIRCPHCAAYVTPEREHLVGWQDATDVMDAGEKAAFVCPACGGLWTEKDRDTANRTGLLVHRGQEVTPDGIVTGAAPRTDTLGFRWSATNNLLVSTAFVGQDEWKASRAANEENAERAMRQFVWAMPHASTAIDLTSLDAHAILKRVGEWRRGYVPTGTRKITVGVDVGKWLCHWVAIAWTDFATPNIIDYGRVEVPSKDLAEERAILLALRGFRDSVLKDGWESEAGKRFADITFIDSGYKPEAAYAFCAESGQKFWPSKGYGTTQRNNERFTQRARSEYVSPGEGFQVVRLADKKTFLVEINADHWKGWVHSRLQTPMNQPGALTLFKAEAEMDHLTIAKHMTSEKKVEEYAAGKGVVTRWIAMSRHNHYFDATVLGSVAASAIGERLLAIDEPPPAPPPAPPAQREPAKRPDWMPERPSTWMR